LEEIFDDFLSDHDRHCKNKTLSVALDGVAWTMKKTHRVWQLFRCSRAGKYLLAQLLWSWSRQTW